MPLYELPESNNNGVLHPHFSKDGTQISWSAMYKATAGVGKKSFGSWKLMVAHFNDHSSKPFLTDITEHQPGDDVFYENHGFSNDLKLLLFSSNMNSEKSSITSNSLYTLNLATGEVKTLASEKYNEHASYSPYSCKIIWGTNKGGRRGMDYWMMNSDGSNQTQLTYFNKRGFPEFGKSRQWAVDMSWNKEGTQIICYVQSNLLTQKGSIYLITFSEPL